MTALNLLETIQRIVQDELRRVHTAEIGLVQEQHAHASDSDTDNYACTVELRNSGVVLKQVPVATPRIGTASIPAVGDLVLVQYINGDLNAPVIVGSLYNDAQRPPVNDDGQVVLHLPLDAAEDEAVHLQVDSTDKREIVLQLGSGLVINLRDDDPAVEIDVDGGRATVTIARDGAISIEAEGDIAIKGQANIDIEAGGDLNLKGATVNIN